MEHTTDAIQDRGILTLPVGRCLYQGEEGRDNDALEIAALRARITSAHVGGGDAIVQLWHEAVDAAKEEKEWLKKHTAALSKQLREQAAVAKRVERARDLAQVAQYRRSPRVMLHSSPADLDDEAVIDVLRSLHLHRESVQRLLPSSLPIATTPSRRLMKRVLRRMDDQSSAGPERMLFPHLKLLVQPRTGETSDELGLAALHNFVCLMTEGGLRKDAANYQSWSSFLACSKPNGKYRSIAIGTVARRLVSCRLMYTIT